VDQLEPVEQVQSEQVLGEWGSLVEQELQVQVQVLQVQEWFESQFQDLRWVERLQVLLQIVLEVVSGSPRVVVKVDLDLVMV
jgi:hypothetical protein